MASDQENTVGYFSAAEENEKVQNGVQKASAITSTWTRRAAIIAYISLFVLTFADSLQNSSTYLYSTYVTSSFSQHSLLSTVSVLQSLFYSVAQLPVAKLSDVFGRSETFTFIIAIYTLSFVMLPLTYNVETYAAASVFQTIGRTGLLIMTQIFVADTSPLVNRGMLSSLPDIPYIITAFVGSYLAGVFLPDNWKWGYGVWAIIIPVVSIPLLISLWSNQIKASKEGKLPPSPYAGQKWSTAILSVLSEMDVVGIILFILGFGLFLVPFTISSYGWTSAIVLAPLVIGVVCLIIFAVWEFKYAPFPMISWSLLRERTVWGGCIGGFFYFMSYYLGSSYLSSWLIAARNLDSTTASLYTALYNITAVIGEFASGFAIRYFKRYKWIGFSGIPLYVLGYAMIFAFRDENTSLGLIAAAELIMGLGLGIFQVAAQVGIQAFASHQSVASVTATFLAITTIGGSVGSAIAGAIWSASIPSKLAEYLPNLTSTEIASIYGSVTVAASYPLGSDTRNGIIRAYTETMHTLVIGGVICAALIGVAVLLQREVRLDQVGGSTNSTEEEEKKPSDS